jgi:hypothetical protein
MSAPYWLQAADVNHVDENQTKKHLWIKNDNPYVYQELLTNYASPNPKRHELGIVGGNEVGLKKWPDMADIESDLRGTTRPLTGCPVNEFKPTRVGQNSIIIDNRKTKMNLDISQPKLAPMQMWSYAPVYAPEPMIQERCGKPEKY